MLRIGPTYYNHTPYARVHNAFLPLFEGAIRLHRCLGGCKRTVFCDVWRLRIVLSSDANMADGLIASRRSAACKYWFLRRHMTAGGKVVSRLLSSHQTVRRRSDRRASRNIRMHPQRSGDVRPNGKRAAVVETATLGKKRRVVTCDAISDNRMRRGGCPLFLGHPVTTLNESWCLCPLCRLPRRLRRPWRSSQSACAFPMLAGSPGSVAAHSICLSLGERSRSSRWAPPRSSSLKASAI